MFRRALAASILVLGACAGDPTGMSGAGTPGPTGTTPGSGMPGMTGTPSTGNPDPIGSNPDPTGGPDPTGNPNPTTGGPNPATGKVLVGYYQSWSDSWKATGAETVLANLPSYMNVVNLSFVMPDTTYVAGSLNLRGTTFLDVPYDGPTLKDAIASLHQRQPNTKVMVSVGGATLYNWGSFHPQAIVSLVEDFGFDGVDLDYEPATPNCMSAGGTVSCPSDAEFVSVIKAMRAALPRPKWLSIAAWSVGAYGEGNWATAQPTGSAYTGIALAVLKDAQASAALDLINVMSYDASPAYDPVQALAAYQHYFKGAIAMGVEVPPEAWGGHVYTMPEIDRLADAVNTSGGAGLMLWSIQKPGGAQSFVTEMCSKLSLSNCSAPLM
jgi:chitinase